MEVKMTDQLVVELSRKGFLEDGYNKCTVGTNGLTFFNSNNETIIITWNQLSTI